MTKAERKKIFILEKSRQLFIEKGFQAVTMTDIVNACEISRGGLYRYYKNTSDIFIEILQHEQKKDCNDFFKGMEEGLSAVTILDSFLHQQKEELLSEKSLLIAIYEFFFMKKEIVKDNLLERQFDSAVELLCKFIRYGIDRGEFKMVDEYAGAHHIILLLEGIRVSSQVMHMSEDLIDEQLNVVKRMLIK